MNDLECSVRHLKQLMSLPTAFTAGTRINEPDDNDLSPTAVLKRQLISEAWRALEFGEATLAGARPTYIPSFAEEIYDRIEIDLAADAEKSDFVTLAQSTEAVIAAAQ